MIQRRKKAEKVIRFSYPDIPFSGWLTVFGFFFGLGSLLILIFSMEEDGSWDVNWACSVPVFVCVGGYMCVLFMNNLKADEFIIFSDFFLHRIHQKKGIRTEKVYFKNISRIMLVKKDSSRRDKSSSMVLYLVWKTNKSSDSVSLDSRHNKTGFISFCTILYEKIENDTIVYDNLEMCILHHHRSKRHFEAWLEQECGLHPNE